MRERRERLDCGLASDDLRLHGLERTHHANTLAFIDILPSVGLFVSLRGTCTRGAWARCTVICTGHGNATALFLWHLGCLRI